LLPWCENLPHKNIGKGVFSLLFVGAPPTYTTKIPLALQYTILPLGFVNNQHLPFSFRAIHFYHFAFYWRVLPWIRHVWTLHDCRFWLHCLGFVLKLWMSCHGYVMYELFMIVAFDSIVWDLYWNCECLTYRHCCNS
jgi:hypothetical protein